MTGVKISSENKMSEFAKSRRPVPWECVVLGSAKHGCGSLQHESKSCWDRWCGLPSQRQQDGISHSTSQCTECDRQGEAVCCPTERAMAEMGGYAPHGIGCQIFELSLGRKGLIAWRKWNAWVWWSIPGLPGLVLADLGLLHIEDRRKSPPERVRSYCPLCCIKHANNIRNKMPFSLPRKWVRLGRVTARSMM